MLTSAVRRTLLATAVGAAALAAPGWASAASISVTRPCYVNKGARPATITVLGSGFIPGDQIAVEGNGVFGTGNADTGGNVAINTEGPILPFAGPGAQTFTLTAMDETQGSGVLAQTTVQMANLAVTTRPTSARLSAKVTWFFSGFRPGRFIYGHYLHGRHNHPVKRARFGRARGACGMLRVRARFYPGGHPRYSKYLLQVDDSGRYRGRRTSPRVLLSIIKFAL